MSKSGPINIQVYRTPDYYFIQESLGLPFGTSLAWTIDKETDIDSFLPEGRILAYNYSEKKEGFTTMYKPTENLAVLLSVGRRGINFQAASSDRETIEAYVKTIRKRFPEYVKDAADGRVRAKFWWLGPQGPNYVSREIAVPDWEEIASNYEPTTKDGIEHLLFKFKPFVGGQLILWQGDPGTGKTYALRSLCDAWKKWCSVEYIVDPDAFFGGSSSYLMNLVSSSEDIYDEEDELDELENPTKKEWKLFILEDTGELLSMDARQRSGQGLARLLNVVDGFIGQGLKILILITSNEELEKLHPAVSRPGRCASIVRFNELPYPHAQEWAKARGIKLPGNKEYTLAELYALTGDYKNKGEEKLSSVFGFRKPE
jgi:hypothetical protein